MLRLLALNPIGRLSETMGTRTHDAAVPCTCQAHGRVSRRAGSPAAEPGPGSAPEGQPMAQKQPGQSLPGPGTLVPNS